MPHGHSWFSVLLGEYYSKAEHAAAALSLDGDTIMGEPIRLQHVFAWILVLTLVTILALLASSKVRDKDKALIPEDKLTLRTFVEILVSATYGQMSEMMGPKAAKFFLPLIGTCAFMILVSNSLGLVPGFLPATDNMNTTLACASIIFFTTHVFGVKEHGLAYFKHFFGPIIWLAPLMLVIELISHVVRPISLSIRLAANMAGDHKVLTLFLGLMPWFAQPAVVPMYLLGTMVVVVQTLVFCLLSTVYISMAIAHEEH